VVSFSIFLAIGVSFFIMLIPLPLIFILLWRKRAFPVNSFFSGATVFILFYLVIRYYAMALVGDQESRGTILSLFISALVVEGGRYAGFLLLPQKEDSPAFSIKSGLSLALGYMTAAFLLISAFEMAMNFVYAGALEGWSFLAASLNRFPQESIDLVQAMILETPPVSYLMETLSLYLAVPVQLCLTLLVFEGFRSNGWRRKGFFFGGAVLYDLLYYKLSTLVAGLGWAVHLLYLTLFVLTAVYLILRFWKEEIFDSLSSL
jgi:hypothetical protein